MLQSDQVALTAVENGLLLSISLLVTFVILVLLLAFVKTNARRTCVIVLFIALEALAFVMYPFVSNFAQALVVEIFVQSCKHVLKAMCASLLMRIAESEKLNFAKANGIYYMLMCGGQGAGFVASPFLVERLGFTVVYLSMGVLLIPLSALSVFYLRLV